MTQSPIETFKFRGIDFYIKRDDLLHKDFSGNKARKFAYFLKNKPLHVNKIISYGSNQSNAMYSLSVFAKMLKCEFIYFTHHEPSFLKCNPVGNYARALQNGMKIYTSQNPKQSALNLEDEKSLYISEGGAMKEASFGIEQLANEIKQYSRGKVFDIFLPSGTGTTALYLQKYLDFDVFTCACVGDEEYLQKQFMQLENKNYPKVIKPPKKYHFGALKKELFDIYLELKQSTNIEFDLLYDPVGWISLFNNLHVFNNDIMYIHQGGILGNESLLQRYERKFLKA